MEVKPGYKETEVGVIPNEWTTSALGEIGDTLIGLTYRPDEVREHGTLVLRSSNIQEGALHFDDNVFVHADIPERIMVRPGDILICVRNGSRDLIGKTALLDERTVGMTFGAFMAVFRSPAGQFVNYLFHSDILKRQINEHLGATINQITNKSLNSFRIPLPATAIEQRAIAATLSDVDALLSGLDRLIAKKRDVKQAAMHQLLTGQARLPGFQEEWKVASLDAITSRATGVWGQNEPDDRNCRRVEIIRAGDISQNGWLTGTATRYVSKAEFEKAACVLDDLVITTSGNGLGKVWWCDGRHDIAASNFVRILRPAQKRVVGRFLYYALRTGEGLRQLDEHTATSAYPNLRPSYFSTAWIPFPELREQRAIAAVLTDMDAELAALEARRTKTAALKQGMMQELLTGRTRLVSPETTNA